MYRPSGPDVADRPSNASCIKLIRVSATGCFAAFLTVPVSVPSKKGDATVVSRDEHPRATTLESLAKLKGVVRPDGTVTPGNASGVNDGAAATLIASEVAARKHGLTPRARIVASAVAGVAPRIMGIGPAPATRKVLALAGLTVRDLDVMIGKNFLLTSHNISLPSVEAAHAKDRVGAQLGGERATHGQNRRPGHPPASASGCRCVRSLLLTGLRCRLRRARIARLTDRSVKR